MIVRFKIGGITCSGTIFCKKRKARGRGICFVLRETYVERSVQVSQSTPVDFSMFSFRFFFA